MMAIYIATEDALSESVIDRLVEEEDQGMHVAVRLGKKGKEFLRKKLPALTKVARSIPVVILADLDSAECAAALIDRWRGRRVLPRTMLFRVAVREIEAWLLADCEGFAQFSGVPLHRMPERPELLGDPKEALLNLVRRYGKRVVKADILPERGSTAKVGLAYNQALCGFVQQAWSPHRAAELSGSLSRTRQRIHELRLDLERS